MPKGKAKRRYTDEWKTKQVKKLIADKKKNPSLTIAWRAEKLDLVPTVLRRWVMDPRYGGDPNIFAKRRKVLTELPTNSQPTGIRRARPLVPTKFECPHCGGAITPI